MSSAKDPFPDRIPRNPEIRSRLIAYIRSHCSDMLGEQVYLLDLPGGLELVLPLVRARHSLSIVSSPEPRG